MHIRPGGYACITNTSATSEAGGSVFLSCRCERRRLEPDPRRTAVRRARPEADRRAFRHRGFGGQWGMGMVFRPLAPSHCALCGPRSDPGGRGLPGHGVAGRRNPGRLPRAGADPGPWPSLAWAAACCKPWWWRTRATSSTATPSRRISSCPPGIWNRPSCWTSASPAGPRLTGP